MHMPDDAHFIYPYVSIVVPVYNRAGLLARCLAALCQQSYPQERYGIIVVDDGSTDDSATVAADIGRAWSGMLTVLKQANGGPSSARNMGISMSQAALVAFTDSDCVAAPDWLDALVRALFATHADGIGGPIANELPRSWVASYLIAAQFFRHRERGRKVDYLLTANVMFKREALLAVDGFSAHKGVWGEDADLSFRLKQAGYHLALSADGVVTHYGTPASLRSLVADLYRYGHGNAILSQRWQNHRSPVVELARHGGATLLAPLIALRLTKHVGVVQALSFCPLIVTEHLAFCWGLLNGWLSGREHHAG